MEGGIVALLLLACSRFFFFCFLQGPALLVVVDFKARRLVFVLLHLALLVLALIDHDGGMRGLLGGLQDLRHLALAGRPPVVVGNPAACFFFVFFIFLESECEQLS